MQAAPSMADQRFDGLFERMRAGRRLSARSGVSQASSWPSCSRATRPASCSTSASVCEAKSKVVPCAAGNFIAQEAPKFRSGQRIEAARRFVENEHRGPVQQRARETQPVYGAGGKCAHLQIHATRSN